MTAKPSFLIAVLIALCSVCAIAVLSGCNKKTAKQSDCALDPTAKPIMGAASAGCLLVIDGALLVTRRSDGGFKERVTPPGGAAQSGESARCAAVRETLEETGLRVKAGKIFAIYRSAFHLFLCELADPNDIAKARTRDVPTGLLANSSEKLLLELPSMRDRRTGRKEGWAFGSNVIVMQDWQKIPGLAGAATPASK